jgi:drug/metabolite transporter (DMT)-like permease
MSTAQLASPQARSAVLVGIGLMLAATLMFSLNDVLGKWLVATYSVGQILLFRSIAAMLMLAPFLLRAGLAPFRRAPRPGLQLFRIVLATFEVACFYAAVRVMPLADAMTFYLAGPIYVTAMSALFLGEKVGIYRWSAVLVGFVGVVVTLGPSAGAFGPGALIALAGSFAYAVLMIVTREVKETSSLVLSVAQALGGLAFGIVAAPLGWVEVRPLDYALLALLGSVSIAAIVLVNQSLRLAPASVVVPYQYTLIVWAVIFGFMFFGDVPELHVILGAAIIVASGLFIFLREQRVAPKTDVSSLPDR